MPEAPVAPVVLPPAPPPPPVFAVSRCAQSSRFRSTRRSTSSAHEPLSISCRRSRAISSISSMSMALILRFMFWPMPWRRSRRRRSALSSPLMTISGHRSIMTDRHQNRQLICSCRFAKRSCLCSKRNIKCGSEKRPINLGYARCSLYSDGGETIMIRL